MMMIMIYDYGGGGDDDRDDSKDIDDKNCDDNYDNYNSITI